MPTDVGDTAMNNTYVVTVKVADGGGLTATHTVTVTVANVNEAPEITNPETMVHVVENRTDVIAATASDVDASDTLRWSVETADDGGKFEINASTGVVTSLSFKNAPNFEMPTDVGDTAMNNTYVVTVKVTDGGFLSATHTFTVEVNDVNEAPEITTSATRASVDENSTAVLTLAASDVDASDTLRWSVEPADDGGRFDINSTTGELSFLNAPDFEMPTDVGDTAMNNTYVVTVKVTDDGSPTNLSDTHTFMVTVADVNETPELTSGPATIAKDENTATTEVIATYVATDPGRDDGDDDVGPGRQRRW